MFLGQMILNIILSEVCYTISGLPDIRHTDALPVYSAAGDILVYDMYATQDEAMTGAKTALEIIAELRKPKAARNSKILSIHRDYSPLLTIQSDIASHREC